ncbi:MAG: hypothetical protein ACMG6E_08765 [Candidatus Roizmanbacteria bacterium]
MDHLKTNHAMDAEALYKQLVDQAWLKLNKRQFEKAEMYPKRKTKKTIKLEKQE